MATHQEIAGVTDQEILDRMVSSHAERFDDQFWDYFQREVAIPKAASIIDIGCGPGLFLRDLSERFPEVSLMGTDITTAMLDYAKSQSYAGPIPTFVEHDITAEPVPLDTGSADLVSMVAVLHVLADPFVALAEIKRILATDGIFLLQDWVRSSLPKYLERMMPADLDETQEAKARKRMLALFPQHNKYTTEDWEWVLGQAQFRIERIDELRSPHSRSFICVHA